jgi:hypothetical protein
MITPKCDKCGKELDEFGAILLSPPIKEIVSQKQINDEMNALYLNKSERTVFKAGVKFALSMLNNKFLVEKQHICVECYGKN